MIHILYYIAPKIYLTLLSFLLLPYIKILSSFSLHYTKITAIKILLFIPLTTHIKISHFSYFIILNFCSFHLFTLNFIALILFYIHFLRANISYHTQGAEFPYIKISCYTSLIIFCSLTLITSYLNFTFLSHRFLLTLKFIISLFHLPILLHFLHSC
jgi:hypothetical protein